MSAQDENVIQEDERKPFLPSRLKEVHHRWGYSTYEGVQDIEYIYKGEKLVGMISGLSVHNFHIQLRNYPNYMMAANKGSYDVEQWEKIVFINKTCSGLSEAGLERAIECMKKIYDMYHDPKTGDFRDYRKTLLDAAAQFGREFDEAHVDEYADIFLRESKRIWLFHVGERMNKESKIVRGKCYKAPVGNDASRIAITKDCDKLEEQRRNYIINAFEKYVLDTLQMDNPYDYVRMNEITPVYRFPRNFPEVVERRLQDHIPKIQAMQFVYTNRVNAEYESRIDCLSSEKLTYRHKMRLKLICNKEYMKRLAQLKCQRAKIEEQKVEKVRNMLFHYAKAELNLEGACVEGYIYYLTPYPDLK